MTPKRVAPLFAITLLIVMLPFLPAAGSSHCQSSSNDKLTYAVTVCMQDPVAGDVLVGEETVTASVTVSGTSPGIESVAFYLDGDYLLTDFAAPYSFTLASDRFVDGLRVLSAEAEMKDRFTSARADVDAAFANGVVEVPPNTSKFSPSPGTTPASGEPFVVAAVGDGANGNPTPVQVTDLIASWSPNMFLYLGDVYQKGSAMEFYNWYRPSRFFGRFKDITNPTIGNHEYFTGSPAGYRDYWNNVPHHYSFDAAGWHFVSLDSTNSFDQRAPGSAQYEWLRQDLSASSAACTLVYFHHPVFSVGKHGDALEMIDIWSLLAQHGVDVVLTGHDHDYQRWKPLNGSGDVVPNGVTEFVVGTGGDEVYKFVRSDSRLAKGFAKAPDAYGALRLALGASSADYRYVNKDGLTLDSGSVACHGPPSDAESPSAPAGVTAAIAPKRVDLSWDPAIDNVGVTGYKIYRNGSPFASVGVATGYSDTTVAPGTDYRYEIRARDAAGNLSYAAELSVTTPTTGAALFSDDFETADLTKWTSSYGLVAQSEIVFAGAFAARGYSTGGATYALKTLTVAQKEVYYRIRVKILEVDSKPLTLMRFRTAKGSGIARVFRTGGGKLALRNEVNGTTTTSTTSVGVGGWHDLHVRLLVNGSGGQIEVWWDRNRVDALRKTTSLGSAAIGRIQLGETATGHLYDIYFDDVSVTPP